MGLRSEYHYNGLMTDRGLTKQDTKKRRDKRVRSGKTTLDMVEINRAGENLIQIDHYDRFSEYR